MHIKGKKGRESKTNMRGNNFKKDGSRIKEHKAKERKQCCN